MSKILKLWQADLSKTNEKAAEALADPLQYENLFPELQIALKAEKVNVIINSTKSYQFMAVLLKNITSLE